MKRQKVSAAAARRIALAAQGFGIQRPDGASNLGHVKRAIDRLGLLQIDLGQRPGPRPLPASVLAAW